jgi:hypothetical protein
MGYLSYRRPISLLIPYHKVLQRINEKHIHAWYFSLFTLLAFGVLHSMEDQVA